MFGGYSELISLEVKVRDGILFKHNDGTLSRMYNLKGLISVFTCFVNGGVCSIGGDEHYYTV